MELTIENLIKIIIGIIVFAVVIVGLYLFFKNYVIDFFKNMGGKEVEVIGIMFLAYLLFALYKSNSDSKDLEEAKASLARFFVETEKEAAQVQISNPEGWYMISWPNNGQSLESCSNIGWASCLCICE